ncbi:hypothetical protein HMPREF3212_04784 [Citrobacter freundii]|nr:hypothetical protein AB07_4621 [Citrobacter freundii]KWZ87302.1 hypothetical protein HMPREF3212_04784 [Citrobacter freundii]
MAQISICAASIDKTNQNNCYKFVTFSSDPVQWLDANRVLHSVFVGDTTF